MYLLCLNSTRVTSLPAEQFFNPHRTQMFSTYTAAEGVGWYDPRHRFASGGARASKKESVSRHETQRLLLIIRVSGQPVTSEVRLRLKHSSLAFKSRLAPPVGIYGQLIAPISLLVSRLRREIAPSLITSIVIREKPSPPLAPPFTFLTPVTSSLT